MKTPKLCFEQIQNGIPGAKANTSLGCLLSMQFDRGTNPLITRLINPWVDIVRERYGFDYDTTLGEVFQLSMRPPTFFMPE